LGIPAGTGLIFYPVPNVGIASKGFSFLVNALDRLHSGQPISLLSVAERGSFRSLAERMPVYEIGRISSDQLLRLAYSAADLLVFPSLAEAQGLVLIESLACGTPVVAFDVGPVHEVVHHMETGYLARHRDPDDLARGISILLSDGELRHRLGRQGRELVINEYSLELEVARYEELYTRSVVSGAACE
jgi:glycosyltransferase involved in cell wall biosynthesis